MRLIPIELKERIYLSGKFAFQYRKDIAMLFEELRNEVLIYDDFYARQVRAAGFA